MMIEMIDETVQQLGWETRSERSREQKIALSSRVMLLLRDNARMTRPIMVEYLREPRTTIFDVLKQLMKTGFVTSYSHPNRPGQNGRPPVYFTLTMKGSEFMELTR